MGPVGGACSGLTSTFFDRFPRLDRSNANWTAESAPDKRYNCIGWAAGDSSQWWQPSGMGGDYWPPGAPLEVTVEAYRAAFEAEGYMPCPTGDFETGYEKVAIFAVAGIDPSHAARQRPDGQWTSKLGEGVDISHKSPEDVGGGLYGEIVLFLRRALKGGSP